MSEKIEFTFKGTPAQLVEVICALTQKQAADSFLAGTLSAAPPALMPQPVSAQQPPPPTPKLTPEAPSGLPATMESLTVDPIYGLGVTSPQGPPSSLVASSPEPASFPPAPENEGVIPSDFDFSSLPLGEEAWATWKAFVEAWNQNYDSPLGDDGFPVEEQPDRLLLLKQLSHSRWAMSILRWVAECGSTQGAVVRALWPEVKGASLSDDQIDLADRLSANITQVSHAAFPDIAGFHDYSTKWSREIREDA